MGVRNVNTNPAPRNHCANDEHRYDRAFESFLGSQVTFVSLQGYQLDCLTQDGPRHNICQDLPDRSVRKQQGLRREYRVLYVFQA